MKERDKAVYTAPVAAVVEVQAGPGILNGSRSATMTVVYGEEDWTE